MMTMTIATLIIAAVLASIAGVIAVGLGRIARHTDSLDRYAWHRREELLNSRRDRAS